MNISLYSHRIYITIKPVFITACQLRSAREMWGAGLRTPPNLRVVKALASPLRAQILDLLARGPMSYTEIMRSLGLNPDRDAGKFAYHLKMLVRVGLIKPNSEDGKYEITDLGRLAHGILEGLEERLSPRRRKMVVRTSRLAMEEFDRAKIAEALIREADVPVELAAKIAREAEERLLMTRVRYLTAPLIRELVNAILLEKGLEEYRHKMTRVGLPVYDVGRLLASSPSLAVREAASGKVLEEYALIGVLYRDVADAHLSGSLHIEDLRHWSLGPSAVCHDLRAILSPRPSASWAEIPIKAPGDLEEALLNIKLLLVACSSEVRQEQALPFFNIFLAPFLAGGWAGRGVEKAIKRFLLELAGLSAAGLSQQITVGLAAQVPAFMRDTELLGPGGERYACSELEEEARQLALAVLKAFRDLAPPSLGLAVDVSAAAQRPDGHEDEVLLAAHELACANGLPVFAAGEVPSVKTFDGSCYVTDWTGDWELDLLRTGRVGRTDVNLPRVAYEARGDLEAFARGLADLLEIAVRASAQRRNFLGERARRKLMPALMAELNGETYFRMRNASYPTAFVGLPEACLALTGELPHEGPDGREAAVKTLEVIRRSLEACWGKLDLRCVPSATCVSNAAARLAKLDVEKYGWGKVRLLAPRDKPSYTAGCLVPDDAGVDLGELLELEAILHQNTPGGHLLFLPPKADSLDRESLLSLTLEALGKGVRALTYPMDLTYCSACHEVFRGRHPKCPACGRVSTISQLVRRPEGYVKVVAGSGGA